MANEEIVALLKEIRDLQKLHVENYKDALRNQQTAIEVQRSVAGLLMIVLLGIAVVVAASFMHR
jgi:ABC-type lipoprotein release transport system permease subunit